MAEALAMTGWPDEHDVACHRAGGLCTGRVRRGSSGQDLAHVTPRLPGNRRSGSRRRQQQSNEDETRDTVVLVSCRLAGIVQCSGGGRSYREAGLAQFEAHAVVQSVRWCYRGRRILRESGLDLSHALVVEMRLSRQCVSISSACAEC